ncbi:hypothetical protein FM107_18270 [Sphingobacterium sp. JB170]|nr:hypothetical protein FM107_18270 [Sphingobacterium sp. JB170]
MMHPVITKNRPIGWGKVHRTKSLITSIFFFVEFAPSVARIFESVSGTF